MKKSFFIIVLPVIYVAVSFVSYFHPGDEYGLYAYSNPVSIGIALLLGNSMDIHKLFFPSLVALVGAALMAGIGYVMDKLLSNKIIWVFFWFIAATLLFLWVVGQYPTIQKAISKNGSWTAYIAGALNMGLYVSVAIVVMIELIKKMIKK